MVGANPTREPFSGSHAPLLEPIPFASRLCGFFSGSHAPAWEPIWVAKASSFCGLAAPRRWHVENAFPRRRVGTRNTMSAGAWERENQSPKMVGFAIALPTLRYKPDRFFGEIHICEM